MSRKPQVFASLEHERITVGGPGVRMNGVELTSSMGLYSWIAFISTSERSHVARDIATVANQVNPVIRALQKHGIRILAERIRGEMKVLGRIKIYSISEHKIRIPLYLLPIKFFSMLSSAVRAYCLVIRGNGVQIFQQDFWRASEISAGASSRVGRISPDSKI